MVFLYYEVDNLKTRVSGLRYESIVKPVPGILRGKDTLFRAPDWRTPLRAFTRIADSHNSLIFEPDNRDFEERTTLPF